ncbi:hypothetical protein [Pseudomonas sp. Teo4]|uniref:hypothetical protein n=1 Tax=Pseudomonas sp. Teo4 TaxID=3064528 RepID=UPI002ACB1276|nr:hypothetical protein [Pseudomonas sp. Teo4]
MPLTSHCRNLGFIHRRRLETAGVAAATPGKTTEKMEKHKPTSQTKDTDRVDDNAEKTRKDIELTPFCRQSRQIIFLTPN